MKTLKFTNKDTSEIQKLLLAINWISVEFEMVTTFENIKEINTTIEKKHQKPKRTNIFLVDNKKVHNHDRYVIEEYLNENFSKLVTTQTCIIKFK